MSTVKDRAVIICLDGLSANQFERLLQDMPGLSSLLKDRSISELDSAPFSDAQPIWAEILTGQPWYRNGCAGYAMPGRSLNELRLFLETDLAAPIRLLPEPVPGQYHVVINAPLLGPLEEQRKWLADAGSSRMTIVSPNELLESEPFRNYKPRPIVSMGQAMSDRDAISKFINAEANRMECAITLAAEPTWSVLLYRASIFDQLAHLLGPYYLDEYRLKVAEDLKKFFAELDESLCQIMSNADKYVVFSGFSHVRCKAMFSLNDFFAKKSLLERTEQNSEKSRLRSQAFALARGSGEETAPPLVAQVTQFLSSKTICGSPIRGSVFINSVDRFADGLVSPENLTTQEDRIELMLTTELNKFSGGKLVRNPESTPHTPNFVVDINAVDLVEAEEWVIREYQLPLSTHDSKGFVWSKNTNGDRLKSVEVAEVVSTS